MNKDLSIDQMIDQIICNESPSIDRRSLIAMLAEQYGTAIVLSKLTRLCETQSMLLAKERAHRSIAEAKLTLFLPNQRASTAAK